ncbi:MAG TPA: RCC1 domain-containing protein, partial [Anaeromyxobacter sp.]
MRHLRRRLQGVLTVVVVGAAVGGCGDTLVDHRNTGVRDAQQPTTCGPGLVQCGTECRSQVVGDPGWVCGTSCTPCPGAPPASASLTCTPVGEGGHDGVCGFQCSPGSLGTVSGCSPPALVAAGGQFSCATAADTGEVHCWGANDQGQLGPGVAGASRDTSGKVQFAPLVGVTALAAGPAHACAAVGGTVYCWGDATGWGGSTSSATPVAVDPLSGVTTLAAGAKHTCGIAAGVLKCAGADVDGGGAPTLGGTVLEIAAG